MNLEEQIRNIQRTKGSSIQHDNPDIGPKRGNIAHFVQLFFWNFFVLNDENVKQISLIEKNDRFL